MLEEIIILCVTTLGFCLITYFLKKWLSGLEDRQKIKLNAIEKEQKKINGKVEKIAESEQQCRESLPERFAPKRKTEENFGKLFDKMGEVAENVAHIKGKIG